MRLLALAEGTRELRDAEVDEFDEVRPARLRAQDEDVLWLQVPVDDARRVRRRERRQELARDRGDLARRELAVPLDARGERLAVQVLHDHISIAVGQRPEVEHFEDVIVADLSGRLRLALEAADGVRVSGRARVEDLDGDAPPDKEVLALVDGPHPACADEADKPVLSVDDVAGLEKHPARPITEPMPVWLSLKGRCALGADCAHAPT